MATARKSGFIVISLIFLSSLIFAVFPANANNVTFSDLNLIQGQIIINEITEVGSVYIGTYNTTDTVALEDGHSYVFTFKPSVATTNFLSPTGIFNFFNTYKDQIIGIVILLLFVGGIGAIIFKVIA